LSWLGITLSCPKTIVCRARVFLFNGRNFAPSRHHFELSRKLFELKANRFGEWQKLRGLLRQISGLRGNGSDLTLLLRELGRSHFGARNLPSEMSGFLFVFWHFRTW
jgi:hypothetical protein